jgi:UDP-N-acetylglucosamine--N-acetylmuramyl-(pentapeptide) pyrophosphoryl-undecaprenol N-acetylglucosamine transferase
MSGVERMKVLISGGGTGGHIYPALAISQKFKTDDCLYVGTKDSLEEELVTKKNIPFRPIAVQGFRRGKILPNVITLLKLMLGIIQSIIINIKFKPDVVIGTGGYVSGPIVFVSSLMGRKTFIHEQNAFPGITNRILGKFVNKVFISYDASKDFFDSKKIIFSGNPVRQEFLEDTSVQKNRQLKTILSFGGSGGAKIINDTMLDVIKTINDYNNLQLIHVTGKRYYGSFMNKLNSQGITLNKNFRVVDYLNDMADTMKTADLVIARAGAITISELKHSKTPSILIPSPNVTDDHQRHNALAMESLGLSQMILEENLTKKVLIDMIDRVLNNHEVIESMKQNFKELKVHDATQIIYETIKNEVKQ